MSDPYICGCRILPLTSVAPSGGNEAERLSSCHDVVLVCGCLPLPVMKRQEAFVPEL